MADNRFVVDHLEISCADTDVVAKVEHQTGASAKRGHETFQPKIHGKQHHHKSAPEIFSQEGEVCAHSPCELLSETNGVILSC